MDSYFPVWVGLYGAISLNCLKTWFLCELSRWRNANVCLEFSRPGSQIVAQYYNFLRLGFEGYKRIQQNSQDIAMYLSGKIAKLGPFELVSDGSDIPVFAFKLKNRRIILCMTSPDYSEKEDG